jgi:hypothetical protein
LISSSMENLVISIVDGIIHEYSRLPYQRG